MGRRSAGIIVIICCPNLIHFAPCINGDAKRGIPKGVSPPDWQISLILSLVSRSKMAPGRPFVMAHRPANAPGSAAGAQIQQIGGRMDFTEVLLHSSVPTDMNVISHNGMVWGKKGGADLGFCWRRAG